jgi:hypothetical protein
MDPGRGPRKNMGRQLRHERFIEAPAFFLNAIHVLWGNIPYIEQYKQVCGAPATPLDSQIPQHEYYFRWSAISADLSNCAIQRRRVALFLPHATERVPMVVL